FQPGSACRMALYARLTARAQRTHRSRGRHYGSRQERDHISMRAISRRLQKLEWGHAAQRNEHRPNPADMLRQRICRRRAAETGRPYEELLRESEQESKA